MLLYVCRSGHGHVVTGVATSPCGRRIASSSMDKVCISVQEPSACDVLSQYAGSLAYDTWLVCHQDSPLPAHGALPLSFGISTSCGGTYLQLAFV